MQALLLFVAGFAASVVNAAAGGGTLISFPALLGAGLGPLQANASSTVGLQAGLIAALWAYRDRLRGMGSDIARLLPPCVLGGALGAALALFLGAKVFAQVVPILLVASAILILVGPFVPKTRVLHEHRGAFFVVIFVVAVYCGYFGAGGGILLLAAMALLMPRPFDEVNALKVLAIPASNGVGALTFVLLELFHPTGVVVWRSVPVMSAGALLGGIAGVRIAKRLPALALRVLSAALGIGMAVWIAVK